MVVRFLVHPQDDHGLYVGECVDLGVSSFGHTMQEALDSTIEAVETYLDALDHLGLRDKVFAERESSSTTR